MEDVYFYAFTIFTSDDFNCLGKALPKKAQMDTRAIDENEALEDRVAKELGKKWAQRGDATDDVSGITTSISSSSALCSSMLSARLGEFNAIEECKAKVKEKKSERKSALELIQCAIQFGTASQKQMGTQILTQELEMLNRNLMMSR
jgi:hypothetical protein